MNTPQDLDSLERLIYETLGGDVVDMRAHTVSVHEEPDELRCTVRLELHTTGGGAPTVIEGSGVGIVDATFHGAKEAMVAAYPSLKHLSFEDFRVNSDMTTRMGEEGSDAFCLAELVVRNEEGRLFNFQDRSRSIASGVVRVVLEALSHFVNTERAVRNMVRAIEDAKSRNRGELAEAYTLKLSDLVKHASYADVVKDARRLLAIEG